MKLKEETIKKLQLIILEDYEINLPLEKVEEIAWGLTGHYDLLAKIHHQTIESPYMPLMEVNKGF